MIPFSQLLTYEFWNWQNKVDSLIPLMFEHMCINRIVIQRVCFSLCVVVCTRECGGQRTNFGMLCLKCHPLLLSPSRIGCLVSKPRSSTQLYRWGLQISDSCFVFVILKTNQSTTMDGSRWLDSCPQALYSLTSQPQTLGLGHVVQNINHC